MDFPWGVIITSLLVKFKRLFRKQTILVYDAHNVHSDLPQIAAGSDKYSIKNLFIKSYYYLQENFSTRLADHILSVSDVDKNRFVTKFSINPNKISIIPSGTIIPDLTSFNNLAIKKKFDLDENKILVLFHGKFTYFPNMEAKKIIENYISIEINKIYDNVIFVFAGIGIKKYKKDNIVSLGFVENIHELISSIDIAIVPICKGGGTRLKILEYMGMGKPIITTKKGIEGINAENYKDAIIVESVDMNFINQLENLIDSPGERDRIGSNARKLAEEKYDWESIGMKLNTLYETIIEEIK